MGRGPLLLVAIASAGALAVGAIVFPATDRPTGDRLRNGMIEGRDIEPLNTFKIELPPMPPRQEIVSLDIPLQHSQDYPLIIKAVEPVAVSGFPLRGIPDHAILSFSLAPRSAEDGDRVIPLGEYVTFPPTAKVMGTCVLQRIEEVEDYVLRAKESPVDAALVAIHIRATSPGEAAIGGIAVTYEAEGQLRRQVLTYALVINVKAGATPRRPFGSERACVEQSNLLPGAKASGA